MLINVGLRVYYHSSQRCDTNTHFSLLYLYISIETEIIEGKKLELLRDNREEKREMSIVSQLLAIIENRPTLSIVRHR